MKYLPKWIVGLVLATTIFAEAAPSPHTIPNDTIVFGKTGSSTKTLEANLSKAGAASNPKQRYNPSTAKWEFSNDGTNFKSLGSGSGSGSGINLLDNGDFESGITSKWTDSDSKVTEETSNPLFDSKSFIFTPTASGQYYTSDSYTIPIGLRGANCAASVFYNTAETTNPVKLQAYDGTNVIAEASLPASSNTVEGIVTFICPSSGTLAVRLASTGSAVALNGDNASIGTNNRVSNVSQASFVGRAVWPATSNCQWSTSSASFASFSADSDCTLPAGSNLEGLASAPGSKIPGVTFSSLPPGRYVIKATGDFQSSAATNAVGYYRLYDGTNGSKEECRMQANDSQFAATPFCQFEFEYTSAQSNITFEIQAKSSGASAGPAADASNLTFSVYRYPLSSELVNRQELMGSAWSGYHGSDCSWARTNTTIGDPTADATCTLVERQNLNFGTVSTSGSVLPAITFTPKRAGRFFVCANASAYSSAVSGLAILRLTDGTNKIADAQYVVTSAGGPQSTLPLCGIYNAASTSPVTLKIQSASNSTNTVTIGGTASTDSTIEWSIFSLDQNLPAPVLVGSVTSQSTGAERIERALISNTANPCSITSQSGPFGLGTASGIAGVCNLTMSTGTFSDKPTCVCAPVQSSVNDATCTIENTTLSATAIRVSTSDASGSTVNGYDFSLICMGPKGSL